ncbi:MAG: tetratricopeptide repeat protein, partial [Candidatus Caldarchaeum sp.]
TTLKNLKNNINIEKSSAYEYFIKGRNAYLLSTPRGYEDAISWYKKALEVDEEYAPAYAGLGEIYTLWVDWKGQSEECWASYNKSLEYSLKATELAPDLSHSRRALAMSYYALGRYEEAEREAKKAIEIDPSDAEAYFVLWKATGKDPDSEYIRKALDLNPELLMARNDLGTAYLASGNYDKAVYHLRRTVNLNPDSALAHNNLGHALAEMGKTEDAIKEYKKAIEIDPYNDLAHSNLATALVKKGEIGDAIREYKKAVEINSDSALYHYNLGTALLLGGKIKEGIKELKITVELNPDFGEAYTNLGRALLEVGKTDEALEAFKQAIDINPDNVLARRNLGRALEDINRTEGALSYQKSIELAP